MQRLTSEAFFGRLEQEAAAVRQVLQADHYIIRKLPPEPADTDLLVNAVLNANGYNRGAATVDFKVNSSATNEAYFMTLVILYEKSHAIDGSRSKTHNFSGGATGNLAAIFHASAATHASTERVHTIEHDQAQEKKWQQEEDARVQREHKQAVEEAERAKKEKVAAIKLQRRQQSLCEMCGKPLSLLEKLARRTNHSKCHSFEP